MYAIARYSTVMRRDNNQLKMSDKFRNRFRISTSRARWWDYGNGSYFITICTRNRIHFFGEINDHKFFPSKIGEIAETYWKKIPDQFRHATLGEFVIMPNHIHGIINIHGSLHESSDMDSKTIDMTDVETRFIAAPQHENYSDNIAKSKKGGITGIYNPMLHHNLSRMIRWYTGRVSYESHKINSDFHWLGRFHDRIIRDAVEYKIKTRYIQKNILNWKEDEFH